jgi:PAS domain S-box-containing protein
VSISHYQRVIALLPEAALIVTPSGWIIATNLPGELLLDRQEASQKSLFDSLNAESRAHAAGYLRQCARSRQPLVGSLIFDRQASAEAHTSYGAVLEPRSEDREAAVLLRLQPRNESNAKFSALKHQIDDLNQEVARRLRAEYQLKAQTQWLEVTLTSIGDAVITTNADNRIAFMNPIAEAMTGWDQHEALGQPLDDVFVIVNEYTEAPVENPAGRALRQRSVVELANHTVLISKQGKRTAIEDTAAPIALDDEIKGVILVFHDVSDRRLLERQLMERAENLELANRRKNEFLTMLAHELRSPLAPISSAAHVMSLQAGQSGISDEPRRVIERQVQHLKRLIDDMLDVSRIISGKMNIVRKNVDFTSLVESACDDFRPQFQQSGIHLSTSISPSKIHIHADAHRIIQVLHNLLANATKFTPAGGSTSVSLSVEEHVAVLRVADTGIGIDESVIADIFEPFTQAAQSLDRSEGGLGLGLSLVKGIIDLHQGEVSISSRGHHKGATLTVVLPLANVKAQVCEDAAPGKVEETHRVLLIEDETDAATTMGQLLELLGHEVHLARTGPEGLKKATAVEPTLIICDIGLPGLDGFAVAERLRRSPVTSTIPLVALTGYGERDFVRRAKAAGFDHHITKPAGIEDIQAALALAKSR